MRHKIVRLMLIAALGVLLGGCEAKVNDAGLTLPVDAKGKLVKPQTPYEQWLTDKPSYFNLSAELQLRIPPQYQQLWLQKDIVPRRLEAMNKVSAGGPLAFIFFMPDFSGFTPQNYDKEFHEDRVYVLIEAVGLGQEKPGAPGGYPENMYQRLLSGGTTIDVSSREMPYGLKCYRRMQKKLESDPDRQSCYGVRNDSSGRLIQLNAMIPPHPDWVQYPLMQAAYFSPDHGGVELIWRTHMKNFPRWKEIDQQIWRWIGEWNIAPQSRPITPQR